jgi:hypothetical protein
MRDGHLPGYSSFQKKSRESQELLTNGGTAFCSMKTMEEVETSFYKRWERKQRGEEKVERHCMQFAALVW